MPDTILATKADLHEMYTRMLPYMGGQADAGFTPVGTIIALMSNHAPANYLICDGTVYNIADYPELANHFLNEFGSKNKFGGNGTTTFAVPNLLGEFLRMTGTNSHANQGNGADVGVHQDSTYLNYMCTNGSNADVGLYINKDNNNDANRVLRNEDSRIMLSSGKTHVFARKTITDRSTSIELGDTIRPTNTSVLYCIATKNIYLNPSLDYSTDEKVVGTWIDGKPVYQKTIVDTMPIVASSGTMATKYIEFSSVGINNVDIIFATNVFIKDSRNLSYELPYLTSSMEIAKYGIRLDAASFGYINSVELSTNHINFSEANVWLTLQYTKNTD